MNLFNGRNWWTPSRFSAEISALERVAEQVALVEYCNVDRGTKWSELRRSHGFAQPHNVRYWCLGNEMDGPWQMGTMTAREYGRKARDAAQQFRVLDPNLKLIACGSSAPSMPTYMVWDREVLEECYDKVDAISLHNYFGNTPETSGNNVSRYLAMNLDMERQIHEIAAVCDYVQGRLKSPKRLWLSFDEWNVWYRARTGVDVDGQRKAAPHLLEEPYNLEDALLVGGFLNTLLRRSDRVGLACLAQLVNVIAPLATNAEKTIRHTIYYPYAWALQYAHGRVLDLMVESDTYPIKGEGLRADFARDEEVPFLDVVATHNPRNGQVAIFMLNRDTTGEREVTIAWQIAHALEGAGLPDVDGTGPEGGEYVRAAEQRGSQEPGCSAAGLVHDLPAPRGFVYGGASGDRRLKLTP